MTNTLSQKGSRAPVSAIILAAGTSSRMGQAKQLLPLGSSTVLAQTIEHACAAKVGEVVLVLGSSAEPIRHQLSPSLLAGIKVVVNQSYEQGMASSLRTGLSALDPQSAAALIILGDQPFTPPQTLDQIIQAYRDSGAPIVIPTWQGTRGNPVLLDRSVFSEALALEGDVGCRAIFGKHLEEIVNVEVEDNGVLLDIDDQADYERLAKK
jgi:molybdenum cofactor cytidylyltransferase